MRIFFRLLLVGFMLQPLSTTMAEVMVTTIAGNVPQNDPTNTRERIFFNGISGIAVDSQGVVYFSNSGDNCIRKLGLDGTVSTFVSSWRHERIKLISDIEVDAHGNVFASDWSKNMVYKVTPTGDVSVFAGNEFSGHLDGPARDALFSRPGGISIDAHGNTYIADSGNHCIRKISPSGMVTTLAGSRQQGFVDGDGAQAWFGIPHDVAVDSIGNVYVADMSNHCIRKITPDGSVSTLAGTGEFGFRDGPGNLAQFKHPTGIAVDADGNVYVADWSDHRVRKIASDGNVSTVAGDGTRGHIDGPARIARLKNPKKIAVDSDGNLLVTDWGSKSIRKIAFVPSTNIANDSDNSDDDDDDSSISLDAIPPRPIHYNQEECAICYEVKSDGDAYDYCSTRCGNTFHKRCIDRCMTRRTRRKCPLCRSKWVADKPDLTIPAAPAQEDG